MQRYVNRGTGKSNVQLIIRFILLISFDNTIKPHPGYSGVAYPELPIPALYSTVTDGVCGTCQYWLVVHTGCVLGVFYSYWWAYRGGWTGNETRGP